MSKSFKFDPDYYDNEYSLRQQRKACNAREDRKIEAQLRRQLIEEDRNHA